MNSRDTDKFPFGLGSTKSCSLLFQYQLGFILIFALVFNIHGMQVFYFIVALMTILEICMSQGAHL